MEAYDVVNIRLLRKTYIGAHLDINKVKNEYLAFLNLDKCEFSLSFSYLEKWSGEEYTYDLYAKTDSSGVILSIDSVECRRLTGDDVLKSSYKNKKMDESDYQRISRKLHDLILEEQKTQGPSPEEEMAAVAKRRETGIEGLAFVLSGKLDHTTTDWENREEIICHLKKHGARIAQKVSSRVDYVVSLDDEIHAAETAAEALGIQVLSKRQFDFLVGKLYFDNEHITIPPWLKEIPPYALDRHALLKTVQLPEGLELVGKEAFAACKELTEITFPSSLVEIGEYAFDGCRSLFAISVPEGASIGEMAFRGCDLLADSNGFIIVNKNLIDSKNRIEGHLTIPDGIKKIGNYAFAFFGKDEYKHKGNGITTIRFPASLKSIGDNAFCTCQELQEVVFNEGLESLGHQVFHDSRKLSQVWIPPSVIRIESDTFDEYRLFSSSHLDVTIYSPKGSYAEQYAIEQGFSFVPSDYETFIQKYQQQ